MGRSEMEIPRGSSAAGFDIATFSPRAETDVVGRHGSLISREVPVTNPDVLEARKAVDGIDALASQEAKEAGRQRADELMVERLGAVSVIDAIRAQELYDALQADIADSSETDPGTGQYL